MSILNKYKRWEDNLIIDKSRCYDFVLSMDRTKLIDIDGKLTTRGLIAYIDTSDDECTREYGALISKSGYTYEFAVNNDTELKNIGLTGIDNGTVMSVSGITTNDELLETIGVSGSTSEFPGNSLYLRTVNGNTNTIEYNSNLVEEENGDKYYSFNGGFLQGFYKLDGLEYSILPDTIDTSWGLDFIIRPRSDYQSTSATTLNELYPNNSGIFFYIGTRAENKFTQFYGCKFDEYNNRKGISGITRSEYTVETSENHIADSDNFTEVITDNKYLIFNRTCQGYTTKTWEEGKKLQIIYGNPKYNENLYTLMNRTCSGYTTHNIDKYLDSISVSEKCNIVNDLVNNAFALRVTEDGKIGYKYLVKDCNTEKNFSIVEEYSKPGIIKQDEWSYVTVILNVKNGTSDKCDKPFGERKMNVYVYVNGYLKLVSKELPALDIRRLNDYSDKQEGVPYNISLGGGTQGLCESIWFDNFKGSAKIFPIEENFAGTFIGDMKVFRFYKEHLQYNEIKNNYLFETKK